jgi:hypothetical protein
MTQEGTSGVSDVVEVGIINVANLEAPVVATTSVSGNSATLTGSGQPGATIELFADGSKVGTATVAADGTFSRWL